MTDLDRATVDRLLTTTRSVRLRLDLERPVDPALVDECLTIALQAPNGSGHELWRFVVVTDRAVRAEVGALYRRASAAYLATLRAADPMLDETSRSFRSSSRLWQRLGDVPVLLVPCLEREPWHLTSEARGYVDASIYGTIFPAVWSFQLACRSRGLGTCFLTSVLKHETELRELLAIPPHFVLGGIVAVAHTSGTFTPAARRPLDDVRRVDRWTSPEP